MLGTNQVRNPHSTFIPLIRALTYTIESNIVYNDVTDSYFDVQFKKEVLSHLSQVRAIWSLLVGSIVYNPIVIMIFG